MKAEGGELELVRLTTISDVADAFNLYLDHAGSHLPIPDPDDLLSTTNDGRLFGCRDTDGRLVAVAGTFWVARCCESFSTQPVAAYELAGMVVHPELRGLRPHSLQDLLVALRAGTLAGQQASGACVISSVAAGNSPSLKSMARCGLRQLDRVPQWLSDVRRTWMAGERPNVVDHVLDGGALVPLLGKLVEASAVPCRTGLPGAVSRDWRMSIAPNLRSSTRAPTKAPVWMKEVPPRRLLGEEPPFQLWPR